MDTGRNRRPANLGSVQVWEILELIPRQKSLLIWDIHPMICQKIGAFICGAMWISLTQNISEPYQVTCHVFARQQVFPCQTDLLRCLYFLMILHLVALTLE